MRIGPQTSSVGRSRARAATKPGIAAERATDGSTMSSRRKDRVVPQERRPSNAGEICGSIETSLRPLSSNSSCEA